MVVLPSILPLFAIANKRISSEVLKMSVVTDTNLMLVS